MFSLTTGCGILSRLSPLEDVVSAGDPAGGDVGDVGGAAGRYKLGCLCLKFSGLCLHLVNLSFRMMEWKLMGHEDVVFNILHDFRTRWKTFWCNITGLVAIVIQGTPVTP